MRADRDPRACKHRSMRRFPTRTIVRNLVAAALFLAGFACLAQDGQPAPKPAQTASAGQAVPSEAAVQQKALLGDNEQKKQITSESSQLLTMAIALKAEVDKTNKDTLSLNVIRKADEIEKLAHTVKEKIK